MLEHPGYWTDISVPFHLRNSTGSKKRPTRDRLFQDALAHRPKPNVNAVELGNKRPVVVQRKMGDF
jgi:hypothetical protein